MEYKVFSSEARGQDPDVCVMFSGPSCCLGFLLQSGVALELHS